MVTKKSATRKRATKKPAKYAGRRGKVPTTTNRQKLVNAGVINPDASFSPQDNETIEGFSTQEVKVLIDVYNDLGEEFFEAYSPNGFVF